MGLPVPHSRFTSMYCHWLLFALAALLVGLSARTGLASGASASDDRLPTVLVLNSYHHGLLWSDGITRGIQETLQAPDAPRCRLLIEYMDTKRFHSPEHLDRFADSLAAKLRTDNPAVVITSDDNALRFALDRRDELFPGVPIVFCGVNHYKPAMIADHADVTGVVETLDIRGTMEIIRELHPQADSLVIVNDRTTTGQANRKLLDEVLPDFAGQLKVEWICDATMVDAQERLRSLPDGTVVLMMSFNLDAAGASYTYRESIARLGPACRVPMYGVWEFYLGRGIVGGVLTSGEEHGRTAAGMARRILEGVPPTTIPVVTDSPNRVAFDATELAEHRIDTDRLPAGATIVNEPVTLWGRYALPVTLAFLAMGGMALVILILTVNIRRRRRAEANSLRYRAKLEEHLARKTGDLDKTKNRLEQAADALAKTVGQLRLREQQHRELLDNLPLGVAMIGNDYRVRLANEAYARMACAGANYCADVPCYMGLEGIDSPCENCPGTEAMTTGEPVDVERERKPNCGRKFDARVRTFPVESVNGEINGFVAIIEDITQHLEAKRRVERSEKLLAETQALARLGGWELDLASNEMLWTDELYRIHELPQNAPLTLSLVLGFIDIEDRGRVAQALQNSIDTGQPFDEEARFISASGRRLWIRVKGAGVCDGDGVPTRLAGTFQDVTDRKRAEIEIRAHLEFLSTLIDTIPNPVFFKGRDLRYTGCNRSFAEDVLGLPMEQIIGKQLEELRGSIPTELARTYRKRDEELLAKGGIQNYESLVRCADGSVRRFEFFKAVFGDAHRDDAGIVGVMIDVTERVRTQEELLRAKEMTEDTNRQLEEAIAEANQLATEAAIADMSKSEFLANMSHEIRTPMTAILGFTEEMLTGSVDPHSQQAHLSTIADNGRHLLALINDILDLSKIEANRIEVERIDCKPDELLQEIVSLMQVRSREKGLELRLEYATAIPETIQTDPTRLRQILVNLLGNAIKFTTEGSVTLRVSQVRDADGTGPLAWALRFEVIDTGIGIAPAKLESIFDPFSQADPSTTRKFGGTGLGLAICQRLSQMLGGEISVHSELGKGSCFTLAIDPGDVAGIPLVQPEISTKPDSQPQQSAQPPKLAGRILLAEDGKDNQRLIGLLLRKTGAEVEIAEDGQQAVQAAMRALGQNRPYDLILMDMQMPVQDGYAATAELRRRGYASPIVALTAHAMRGDRDRCIEAGCDGYATKPIDRPVFYRILASHLPAAQTT